MVKGTSGYSYGLGLACFALVVAMAGATQLKVGGGNGWSVPAANAESYNDWAEKMRFQIGDTLVFVYPKDKDSVLVVEPADYNACNTSSFDQKFADGNTVFTLDRAGAFFFISGVDANCRAGEKLIVMVLASRNGTATATAPSPPPASSTAPPPTSPAPASPPPSSPSPPPASPPSPSSSGAAAPTTPPPASSPPSTPTPASPAPSASSPPAPPSANAPSAQGARNPSATSSPPPAANGAAHAAVAASGLAAGIIGYAMLAL
ncbi:early nodulin-like protein 18 [Oryza sativa Japonica Group]|uniref:Os02g0162200 protein n=1 Tax=Oryza sativa subsp. japonica TaxID=39947 RepID=C7IZA4_ORYSJ|nr:early nodulin-like protein 1 [Oryza sativa Japonica Group]KAF2943218.1 hypothetical protein DAI22_02g049800 [Oryza sativa Japonica Group]BAH91541.1 Os02g0162200 [Oryza sativa Japonica Group]|eukprot:NP_001172812.1 Os02g0162200 [Oryza sativa Japonica Group]